MTDSALHPSSPSYADPDRSALVHVRRLAFHLSIATLLLMAVGSATRVMNAGLACPDWPLCYGQLLPRQQMNLQVFLEWFHRLDAALIGLGAIALLGLSLWQRRQLPRWVPWVSGLALLLVILQGSLGALTVTELLRFDIVTAHLGMALLFFLVLIGIHTALLPYQGSGNTGKLHWWGTGAASLIYLQSLLGGLVGSRWALHQCLETSHLCTVMNSHIAGVLPPTLAVACLIWLVWRTPALSFSLRRLANWAAGLLVVQICLGVATFHLHLQVEPLTVAHQAVGAALFGTLVAFSVLAWRDRNDAILSQSEVTV